MKALKVIYHPQSDADNFTTLQEYLDSLGSIVDPVTGDINLPAGATINWDSGNQTITQSAGKLTFSGIIAIGQPIYAFDPDGGGALAQGDAQTYTNAKTVLYRAETGFASNTQYNHTVSVLDVTPTSDSDITTSTFTDYVGVQTVAQSPVAETEDIGKMRSLAAYTYHFGTGAMTYGFGATLEFWNQRSAHITQAEGVLIGVFNDVGPIGSAGSTGLIDTAIGASCVVQNGRNSGTGMTDAAAVRGVTENLDSGTITTGTGGYFQVINDAAGTIPTAIAVDAWTSWAGSGGSTTAYGLKVNVAVNAAATVGTYYGLYLGNNAAGTITTKYSIFSDNIGPNLFAGSMLIKKDTAIPAGGSAGVGYRFSNTTNFGIFFGSGAPGLQAATGSLYLRSDGSGTTNRMYVNIDGNTTWTAVVTVA